MDRSLEGWSEGRVLGDCPRCDWTIPRDALLIAYHREGEWPRMLARCPFCTRVVAPA